MIEPRSADESVLTTLNRARALIEAREFESATLQLIQLLDAELDTRLRGEVLTNLGAALCLSARGRRDSLAIAQLNQARDLLVEAVACRPRREAPTEWATTRANLAVVHVARYEASGNSDDLLSAHLALDDTKQAVDEVGDAALHDWLAAIRDQLLELSERRAVHR